MGGRLRPIWGATFDRRAHPAERPTRARRGRPAKYGEKLKLRELFDDESRFSSGIITGYEGERTEVDYCSMDLLWRPVGRIVRFVLVRYPGHGKIILMTTDLRLEPLQVIAMYAKRFKIEVSFKQSIHTIGAYSYHFWLKEMERIKRGSGNQHLHRKSKEYREAVQAKVEAYERFVALGLVAQGLMQYLSTYFPAEVYSHSPWLRTNTKSGHPSQQSVLEDLRVSLPEFLSSTTDTCALKKILTQWQANPWTTTAGEAA